MHGASRLAVLNLSLTDNQRDSEPQAHLGSLPLSGVLRGLLLVAELEEELVPSTGVDCSAANIVYWLFGRNFAHFQREWT